MKKSLLLVAVLVTSCATGAKYVESNSITPGYGRITFLRTSGVELLSTDLSIDSVKVATLSGSETASVEVKPGSYAICRNHTADGDLCLKDKLVVADNQSRYVISDTSSLNSASGWVTAALGHVTINYSITLLDPAAAKEQLKDYREVAPLLGKYPN